MLKRSIKLSETLICTVEIAWLPHSWPVVKTQVRIDNTLFSYDVTVGLLMDYAGGVDDILAHIIKQATAGIAETIINRL